MPWYTARQDLGSAQNGLVIGYRRFRFSNTAYSLMAFWLFLHTIGGHHTFANVPFDWFNELIGSQGDICDAQKDMLADTLGALFALLLFALVRPDLSEHRTMDH